MWLVLVLSGWSGSLVSAGNGLWSFSDLDRLRSTLADAGDGSTAINERRPQLRAAAHITLYGTPGSEPLFEILGIGGGTRLLYARRGGIRVSPSCR